MDPNQTDHDPRLHAVLVAICVLIPLGAAIWSWPADAGRYTDAAVAIWADGVFVLMTISLTFYRFIITLRGKSYFEQAFLTVVLWTFPWSHDSALDLRDIAGKSLATLLLHDRQIFVGAALFATVLLLMIRDRRKRLAPGPSAD